MMWYLLNFDVFVAHLLSTYDTDLNNLAWNCEQHLNDSKYFLYTLSLSESSLMILKENQIFFFSNQFSMFYLLIQ